MPCLAHDQRPKPGINGSQMVDVVQFFFAITEQYEAFGQEIRKIIDNIPVSTPKQIAEQCARVKEQKDRLAAMDEQMFAIVELAGNDIAQNPMVDEYRVAFARANIACNSLYQKLLSVRAALPEVGRRAVSSEMA